MEQANSTHLSPSTFASPDHRFGRARRPRWGMLLLLLAVLCMPLCPVFGATQSGIDAVLVIDSSGSMKETDPQRLRVPAAKMFLSLLGDGDRAGLVSFSDDGYPVVHLTPTTSRNQKTLHQGVEKVSALGVYTNLHAALETGWAMLREQGDPERRRMLVLMSDGKMDVGDWDRDQALRKRIEDELIAELDAAGVEVYTIAFTEASDMSLMRSIANGTGGIARMASNDRELHGTFSTIFESAKQPDMLPIAGGEFIVDPAVDEVTIVASKENPGSEINLLMPDGRKITSAVAGRAVRWFESDRFDMITIEDPPPGTWTLVSDLEDNKAYVVTNMGLEAEVSEETVEIGAPVSVTAWLHQDGETIASEEMLDNTTFNLEIISPEGDSRTLMLTGPAEAEEAAGGGRFSESFQLDAPGDYRLRVQAKSETFQREKALFVEVPAPPDGVKPEPEPQPEPQPEPEPQAEPASPSDPVAEEGREDDNSGAESGEEDNGPQLMLILGLFILANIVIGGTIGGILWWRKRKAGRKAATADTGEDEDEDAEEEPRAE